MTGNEDLWVILQSSKIRQILREDPLIQHHAEPTREDPLIQHHAEATF